MSAVWTRINVKEVGAFLEDVSVEGDRVLLQAQFSHLAPPALSQMLTGNPNETHRKIRRHPMATRSR